MANLWPGLHGPNVNYISSPPTEQWCREFPRSIVLLGSTGSVGRNAFKLICENQERFRVIGLSCARQWQLLAEQAASLRPPYLAVLNESVRDQLFSALPSDYRPTIFVGGPGYSALAALPEASTVLSAQSGAAGLAGTLAALVAGKVICLANKESLVLAGNLVRDLCRLTGAVILPVDSEHNAIFQCLAGRNQDVDTLVLTASGGPFWGKTKEMLKQVTLEEALKHPNWSMGKKITIDSATMMNKGLEIIEAYHLYGVQLDRIEVVIHPQSVIHSLVRMQDASLLAQFASPDMKLPLAHCLFWPNLLPQVVDRLDLFCYE